MCWFSAAAHSAHTGVGEKICCDFGRTLPSSISGTRSRAMRRWKAHDEENSSTVFVFSFSCFAGFFCEKNILAVGWEKTICVTVFGPVIEKIRENTRAFLDDGYNFNFYPEMEEPRFLSFSGCSAEGAPTERFVLASASY